MRFTTAGCGSTKPALYLPLVATVLFLGMTTHTTAEQATADAALAPHALETTAPEIMLSARKYSPFCIFGADSAKVAKKGSKRGAGIQTEDGECAPRRSGRVA